MNTEFTATQSHGQKARTVSVTTRDELFEMSVRFGLSQSDIILFSYSWGQPITTQPQVSKKIGAMNLRTVHERTKRKREGYHNQVTNAVFCRLVGQAIEKGYEIGNVTRESKRFDESTVQPDFAVDIKGHTVCVEIQASKTTFTLWGKKLARYTQLYKELGDTFTVLVLVHSRDELRRAREGARRAMKENKLHLLFLFGTIAEFGEGDVLHEKRFLSPFSQEKRFFLLK